MFFEGNILSIKMDIYIYNINILNGRSYELKWMAMMARGSPISGNLDMDREQICRLMMIDM